MRIIELRLPERYFEKDQENFLEARLANFDLEKGDVIRFKEWNEKEDAYTGRFFDRKVKNFHKMRKALRYWSAEDLEKYGIYILQLEDDK